MVGILTALALVLQDADPKQIDELIRTLSDDSLETRQKAADDLVKIGKPALAALNKASESGDAEVKKRALEIIEKIHWGRSYAKLQQYVQDRYEKDEVKIEPLKLKSFQLWFPDTRFYEFAEPQAAGGGMVAMGGGRKSIFATRKDDDGLVRVMVQGILFADALTELLAKADVRLDSPERAFDFATSFLQLYWSGMGSSHAYYSGTASRFGRTKEGWELTTPMYGTNLIFKTDASGKLTDIGTKGPNWYGAREDTDEKNRLELEKLKLEIEVLRKQLEKK